MNNCQLCEARLAIDERISHQGKIVCGHCFVKMPENHKVDAQPGEQVPADTLLVQAMELLVDHQERISALEERLDKLDIQFDSICG